MTAPPDRIWAWVWDLPYPSKYQGKTEWSAAVIPAEQDTQEYILRNGPTMQAAIAAARAEGREQGLREAARLAFDRYLGWNAECGVHCDATACEDIGNAILALLPLSPSPVAASRGGDAGINETCRASGPIDPEQGFATSGAEARWIADTDAGVYDNAPCPTCGRELLIEDGHVYCRHDHRSKGDAR